MQVIREHHQHSARIELDQPLGHQVGHQMNPTKWEPCTLYYYKDY